MGTVHRTSLIINRMLRHLRGKVDNNQTAGNCSAPPVRDTEFLTWCLLPGIVIPLVLGLLLRRRSLWTKKWGGRPGLAIPMNCLEMRHIRIAYLIAFGATISSVMIIFRAESLTISTATLPDWAKSFVTILNVGVFGTIWYPFFAAISAENVIGYFLGTLYAIAHLAVNLYNLMACSNLSTEAESMAYLLLHDVPSIFFLLLLVVYFPVVAVLRIRGARQPSEVAREKEERAMRDYVRQLLSVRPRADGTVEELKMKLKELHLAGRTGFIFPPRFLCSLLVAGIVLYVLAMASFVHGLPLLDFLIKIIVDSSAGGDRPIEEVVCSVYVFNLSMIIVNWVQLVEYSLWVLKVSYIVATSVAMGISVLHFGLILRNFRRNVLLAYQGKYPYIKNHRELSPLSAIMGFSCYTGYQTAYLVWGFGIHLLLLWPICILLAFGMAIPIKFGCGDFWLQFLKKAWPVILIPFLLSWAQQCVTYVLFVQRRTSNIAINNRQVYFVWTYYMFFYNLFLGLFSCLKRVLNSLMVGLFFVGRIDVAVMPRAFEDQDPGFGVYSGFVLTEVAHNNPILRTFLSLLAEEGGAERLRVNEWPSPASVEPLVFHTLCWDRGRRARLRWQLLYSLFHNASLVPLRKHHLARRRSAMAKKMARGDEKTTML